MDAYEGTPAGMVRTILRDTSRLPIGDPALMVKIMIDSVDQNPAPKRIVLGSDAYTAIQKALAERLAAVEAQKELRLRPTCVQVSDERMQTSLMCKAPSAAAPWRMFAGER